MRFALATKKAAFSTEWTKTPTLHGQLIFSSSRVFYLYRLAGTETQPVLHSKSCLKKIKTKDPAYTKRKH